MLKRTFTYVNYNGDEVTEDLYFNLTKTEVLEMEVSEEGGLVKKLERIIASKDVKEMMKHFRDLILKAYGEKSPDGRKFLKSKERSEEFACTEPYNILFQELSTNNEAAAAFVNGIVSSIVEDPKIKKALEEQQKKLDEEKATETNG